MPVAKSIKLAVVLALYTYPDSYVGEQLPGELLDLAIEEGLMGRSGSGGLYMTDEGRSRLVRMMEAL